ncbi:hypothetical protein [Salinifilum ghardaiensis]
MRFEALAQLVDRQADLGTGWVPLQQVAHLLGWSPQQQRSQLSTLQHVLEAHPWYLALTQASTGPVVHVEDLRARARQLTHGYRAGLA